MAVIQISRIQHRRGKEQDFPQLASAELGWSLDTRRLFIGNGTILEGAPTEGATEILTEYSNILDLASTYTFQGKDIAGFPIDTGPDKNNPVVRTLQSKFDDIVSVRDFGAKGDGITDDTAAIQRALTRPLGAPESVVAGATNFRHRAVYFPAGNYIVSSTILIPPYTKVYGEGKTVSRIIGNIDGPVARLSDSFFQIAEDFGTSNDAGVSPYVSEFHVTDMSFWQIEPTFTKPCFQIDGGIAIFFTHCQFKGTTLDYPLTDGTDNSNYTFDRGDGAAAMYIPAISYNNSVENVVITACDMYDHNYGLQIDNDVRNIVVRDCYFDRSYNSIVINRYLLDIAYIPRAVIVEGCHFRHSVAEGIWSGERVRGVISSGNFYYSSGQGPVNEYGTAYTVGISDSPYNFSPLTPSITFNSDFNFSIGDYYDRVYPAVYAQTGTTVSIDADKNSWVPNGQLTNVRYTSGSAISGAFQMDTTDRHNFTYEAELPQDTSGYCVIEYNTAFPTVETNGYQCYVIAHGFGLKNGVSVSREGRKITLPDSPTFASSGLMLGYSTDPTSNLEIKYLVEHNNARRMGTLRIVNYYGAITWDDEYHESDDTLFDWNVIPVGSVTGVDVLLRLASSSPGTGYTADVDVPTTAITGSGTGLTLKIISYIQGDASESHVVDSVLIAYVMNPGSGYAVGDTVSVDAGNGDAVVTITHVKDMEIQYISEAVGDSAMLSYNLNYFDI